MSACTCFPRIVGRCEHCQESARRVLETIKTLRPARLGEPGAKGMVVLDQRPVNVVPSPGFRRGGYVSKETRP